MGAWRWGGGSFAKGPEVGSSTGDFESWMNGALGMKRLFLKRLRGGGLGGSSFTGEPGRYVKKVSGYGHVSPWWSLPSQGTCYVRGGLIPRTSIDECRRALEVGHLSARGSMKGTLREGSITGEPER